MHFTTTTTAFATKIRFTLHERNQRNPKPTLHKYTHTHTRKITRVPASKRARSVWILWTHWFHMSLNPGRAPDPQQQQQRELLSAQHPRSKRSNNNNNNEAQRMKQPTTLQQHSFHLSLSVSTLSRSICVGRRAVSAVVLSCAPSSPSAASHRSKTCAWMLWHCVCVGHVAGWIYALRFEECRARTEQQQQQQHSSGQQSGRVKCERDDTSVVRLEQTGRYPTIRFGNSDRRLVCLCVCLGGLLEYVGVCIYSDALKTQSRDEGFSAKLRCVTFFVALCRLCRLWRCEMRATGRNAEFSRQTGNAPLPPGCFPRLCEANTKCVLLFHNFRDLSIAKRPTRPKTPFHPHLIQSPAVYPFIISAEQSREHRQ